MKLSECKHGVLVEYAKGYGISQIGMVVGITENPVKEAIPLIQWQKGEVVPQHHKLLGLYEE